MLIWSLPALELVFAHSRGTAGVEYANGDEVPAAAIHITEVETVVLESILERLSRDVGGNGGRYGPRQHRSRDSLLHSLAVYVQVG